MDFKDYYKVLGLSKDASTDDIKKAFRKLARKYHPDINPGKGAEIKFKEVNEAYEALKNPERRAAYDQLGQEPPQQQEWTRKPADPDGGFSFSRDHTAADFSDFFESLYRHQGSRPHDMANAPGADRHGRIEITIEDAYTGATRQLDLRTPVLGRDGSVTFEDRTLSVSIPKGTTQGQHIRLSGQGDRGIGQGPAGDLFLEVTFAAHPVYRPDGKDLYLDLSIAPWEAALGGHVVMPTPGGKVDLRIPKNARTGQKLRLRGKGLPGVAPGDIYATLRIVNPKVETAEARAFFEDMAERLAFDSRAQMGG
ncbi:DnaJ domain-containing protein [Sulfitobacter sp. S190]|nr:DnaJ domain-containing protein [Sulfitobacter sp. S190]